MGETRTLAQAGFGVPAFDRPGDGASGGSGPRGLPERRALGAAIDRLAKRPDVATRLGGMGFSRSARRIPRLVSGKCVQYFVSR